MIVVDIVETPSLGDRSYVVSDGSLAVVVDPQRDLDRIEAVLDSRGVRVSHVLETHVHNDYVTGGYELAGRTGAVYVVAAGDDVEFDRLPVRDGEEIEAGAMRIRVLHTPGHTHHHVSYLIADAEGTVHGVFTGGSMLFGATGRTDLVGPEYTDELTHAQFHSVRRIAAEAPESAQVYPTHGFGSFCSATPTTGDSSSVGKQRQENPALTLDEQKYVDTLLAGLDAYPAYYVHMAPINRSGPAPVNLSDPELVDVATLRERVAAGEWVVDLRSRRAFAAGHLPGTRNFEAGQNFATYLGWLHAWGAPLTLIGEDLEQVRTARRELVRIGVDRLAGASTLGDQTAEVGEARSYRVADFAALAAARRTGPVRILDARRDDEWRDGHVEGAMHIPVHQLMNRQDEVPDGEVWVYCGSGYRAAIAASILDRSGREVVLIDAPFADAQSQGLIG